METSGSFLCFSLQDPFILSVQQGDLRLLMRLLSRDASGINTCDEVHTVLENFPWDVFQELKLGY